MANSDRIYQWNGHRHTIGMPRLSDVQMAGTVRMLMRDQLNHEVVCTAARDRIVCLMMERDELARNLDRLVKTIEGKGEVKVAAGVHDALAKAKANLKAHADNAAPEMDTQHEGHTE